MKVIKNFFKRFLWCRKLNDIFFRRYYKQKYTKEENYFIETNGSFWKKQINFTEINGWIMVDFTTPAPDNFWGVMKKACAYREKYGYKILAVLDGVNCESNNNGRIIESFNVDKFLYKDNFSKEKVIQSVEAIFKGILIFFKYKETKDLIEYSIGNVKIGDCIYDTIIRSDNTIVTLDKLRITDIRYLFNAISRYIFFNKTIKKFKIKIYLTPEYAYLQGINIRSAVKNGIMTNVINQFVDTIYSKENMYNSPLALKNYITQQDIECLLKKDSMLKDKVDKYFNDRIFGRVEMFDAKNSFKNKKQYNKDKFLDVFSIKNNKKNIFILPNVFSDAIHGSRQYIFKDYYNWLIFTLDSLSNNKNINVFVKPHPSRSGYGENGVIERILRRYSNVMITPEDISTLSIINIADVILSGSGTIGLEASCLGVPVIITSDSYYNGFDLVNVATSLKEYEEYLRNIDTMEKNNNKDKIDLAKLVLFLAHNNGRKSEINFKNMNILPGENFREICRQQYIYLNGMIKNENYIKDDEYKKWLINL